MIERFVTGIRPRRFIATLAVIFGGGLAGCYEETGPEAEALPATTAPAGADADTDTSAASTADTGNAKSTLGRAKESATNTIDELERRQQEIADTIGDE